MPTPSSDFHRVGVTGGIGSGKSIVCSLFEELGRTVLSADRIARELTESDGVVRAAITKAFGNDVYGANGTLDRKRLAAIVFTDARLRRKLDGIVHPRVFVALDHALEELPPERRRPYVIIEAALIYESGLHKHLDAVVVVHAEEETRITRVMRRDHCTREEVLMRMQAQLPADTKVTRADFVIYNEHNSVDLAAKVSFIDSLLKARCV